MKVLSLAIALTLVSVVGNAASITKQLRLDVKKTIEAKFKKSEGNVMQIPTACTNFTGKWTGVCKDGDNQASTKTINITQKGCTEFTGEIPSLVSKISSGIDMDSKESSAIWATIDWDKDGKNLFLIYGASGREMAAANSYSASLLVGYKLTGSKLTVETSGVVFGTQAGQAGSGDISETCTMTKMP
ncbi:MAG: hypothetical protein SGI74_08365 [Oligoflexia bacterium]|nr:hypothetical protein [Oligoflexia bacterium]